eukprot:scaffold1393_cov343-Prasinococcus_capsulatus_cf.AAC.10
MDISIDGEHSWTGALGRPLACAQGPILKARSPAHSAAHADESVATQCKEQHQFGRMENYYCQAGTGRGYNLHSLRLAVHTGPGHGEVLGRVGVSRARCKRRPCPAM